MTDDPSDPFLVEGPPAPTHPPRRQFPWRTANLVAGGLVLFLLGAAVQTFRQPAGQPLDEERPRFALLFYSGPPPLDRVPLDEPEEIRTWVRDLRNQGHYVAGELLALGALEVERDTTWVAWVPGMSIGPMFSALFVVSAASAEEVVSIAQSSPHVRNGGRIIVRPIEKI